jgi:membrane peptidoglycan carboxypeptidase
VASSPARPHKAITLIKLLGIMLVTGVLGAGVLLPYVGGLGFAADREASKFLDESCSLSETPPPQKTIVYARDGHTVIAELFKEDRQPVPLSDVPKYLQQALIATEDRRFYTHHGVDMRGLLRSALSTGSGSTQGGSTLTMQYVKQVRYYQAKTDAEKQAAIDQNINRKIEDAQCAMEIERRESKQTILQNYLNIAFFGENSYSIQTAAQTFFNKPVNALTLPESALLVGAVRAPAQYDAFDNPGAAKQRRNEVIQNMVEVGDLSQSQANAYKAQPVKLATLKAPPVRRGCYNANPAIKNVGFFCQYVTNWLTSNGGLSDTTLNTGGLRIVTTLDPNLQNSAQQGLSAAMKASSAATAISPQVDPKTGDVLAMVSNKLYGTAADGQHSAANLFTDASANAASTYKLFSLIAALKAGVDPDAFQLQTANPYLATGCGASVAIPNDNQNIPGLDSLRDATVRSSNTFYIALEEKLFQGCDLSPIVGTAQGLGMTTLNQQVGNSPSQTLAKRIISQRQFGFTIGTYATSPLQLAGAYATIANDGIFCPPSPILSVKDASGKTLPTGRKPCSPQMTPQVARQAVNVLVGDAVGVGTAAPAYQAYVGAGGSQVAGKTGTQNAEQPITDNSAIWYAGVTPNLTGVMAVYNPRSPSGPLKGVPGAPDGQAQGANAAALWLDAVQPTLLTQHWAWPGVNDVTGAISAQPIPVPPVTNLPLDAATAQLTAQGFKVVNFSQVYPGVRCGSSAPYDTVAYYSPKSAVPGSTVTVCVSNGQTPYAPPPPPPPRSTAPNGRPTTTTPTQPNQPTRPTRPTRTIPPNR